MSSLFDVRGKVAIVTGGSRGIGQAIATRYAEAGMHVVISSRKAEGLDTAVAEIKAATDGTGDVTPIVAHNGDKAALQALVAQTVAQYGGVDVLVNNAATNPHFGTLLGAEDSMWQKTWEVNIMGNVWLTQAAVAEMRERGGGKIINVASVNGIRPGTMQGIYSLTKAAVINLTQTLAMELAADNIQANAIAPGLIKTKFAQAIWDNPTLLEGIIQRTPQRRMGDPDDIAGMALYLASPASGFTTGQVYVVDGGITLPML
ncbi:MAG: glucose 1-dehydrogenase [Armatimonadetes bacterium]|nr:glucose 1-dehydrogenase [Anaerolineae bacterium]